MISRFTPTFAAFRTPQKTTSSAHFGMAITEEEAAANRRFMEDPDNFEAVIELQVKEGLRPAAALKKAMKNAKEKKK